MPVASAIVRTKGIDPPSRMNTVGRPNAFAKARFATSKTGWVVGATGREWGRDSEGDGTTTHHYYAEDVHDFAWTTSPDYLERVDPKAAMVARERYGCLAPWRNDPATYGRMALTEGYARKTDIGFGGGAAGGWWGGFAAAGGSGYQNTEIGQVIVLAYLDAYTKLVTQLGGLPTNAAAAAPRAR